MRLLKYIVPLIGFIALFAMPASARAANYGVQDDGHFFSADAITQAERTISDIHSAHKREVWVQTVPSIPDSMKGDFESQGKDHFFENWAGEIGRKHSVGGVVILACKDPGHLQIVVGDKSNKAFTEDDRRALVSQMLSAFKAKEFDRGLTDGVKFIQTRMDRDLGTRSASAAPTSYTPPTPTTPNYTPPVSSSHSVGLGMGSWLCIGVGILVVVFFIIAIASRSRGGQGYGYGAPPPPGGYPPGYSGGYPQQGGYYGGGMGGGGGGGFGRGILGGLLGGALGAWGYDKFSGRSNENYGNPNMGGGGNAGGGSAPAPDNYSADQPDNNFSGSGGDFGSSSNDSSSSSGGDFGSSDSGSSGGGDFSSSGGDFGGGGGDSGGGGGGGGGDF